MLMVSPHMVFGASWRVVLMQILRKSFYAKKSYGADMTGAVEVSY